MAVVGSTAFSSSGEDVIKRAIPITSGPRNVPNPTMPEELALVEELYELEWTANEVAKAGYKQIALQFPDELLHISVPIYQSLKRRLDTETGIYVLADTSYGSCCVDEVAAQHINADVIVHYGYSCLSRPSRIPVLYVFSKAQLEINNATDLFLNLACRGISVSQTAMQFILIPDVAYAHAADELYAAIQRSPMLPPDSQVFYNPVPKWDNPAPPPRRDSSNSHPLPVLGVEADSDTQTSSPPPSSSRSHTRYTLPASVSVSSCTILYVGPESLGLTNLLMTHPENTACGIRIISYDPTSQPPTARIESARTNRLLMRRYAVVQRARDADVFGILVGTLGVASYLPLLSYIRRLLRRHQKKFYTLSVGKLNPAKLANFAEIECFVMVACPENSVIDAKEFLRPIVTPFELSLALNAEPSWPGNYILDFEHVIAHQAQVNQNDVTDKDDYDADRPLFSLVTGKYRHVKRYGDDDLSPAASAGVSAVILRNTDNALTRVSDSAGADFLQQRSFKGLEQRLGEDAPSVLEQGRSGIARGYQDDHSPSESASG